MQKVHIFVIINIDHQHFSNKTTPIFLNRHTMTTAEFIASHRNEDVRSLALKYQGTEGIDLTFALEQIAGWQTARRKLPSWAATDGLTYPPHLSMEQCSSEQTAHYKAEVAHRLVEQMMAERGGETVLTDLTGGFGVDFSFMARGFDKGVYVERNDKLCAIAEANFKSLGLDNVRCVCADCTAYLPEAEDATLFFIDPARRDGNGARTYAISDCTPDILTMLPVMLAKTGAVMVKLSPMLDLSQTVKEIESVEGAHVSQIHIVSTGNECKELLVVITRSEGGGRRTFCVNDDSVFAYDDEAATSTHTEEAAQCAALLSGAADRGNVTEVLKGMYLHVPDSSVMKAGCFALLSARTGVAPLGANSHLFVAHEAAEAFPGRTFRIDTASTMNRKKLKRELAGISKANVAVRNFPLSADALRKRLKLKDGGDTYIFGTTVAGEHVLLICEKPK